MGSDRSPRPEIEGAIQAARQLGTRVLLIGHVATRWALDHTLLGMPLETLVEAPFAWREGWEYTLPDGGAR